MAAISFNIEQLRCHSFLRQGMDFDLLRLEDFTRQTVVGNQVHRHNYYMLMWVTSGTGTQLVDFKRFGMEPGRIFAMYPGQLHALETQGALEGFVLFFTAHFFNLRYHNHQLTEFPFFQPQAVCPFITLKPDAPETLQYLRLWNDMLMEYESAKMDYAKLLRSYLNIILIQYYRFYTEQYGEQSANDSGAADTVQKFQHLIEQEFMRKHKVRDYARELLISPNYLNSIAIKITGKQAGVLIRERIMLEAKRMLIHEKMTIAEIGHRLGFEDNSYFSRFFRKYEGDTPEAFRKQFKRLEIK